MRNRFFMLFYRLSAKQMPRLGQPSIERVIHDALSDALSEAERIGGETDAPNAMIKNKVASRVIEDLLIYLSALNENEPFLAQRIYRDMIHKIRMQSGFAAIRVIENGGQS